MVRVRFELKYVLLRVRPNPISTSKEYKAFSLFSGSKLWHQYDSDGSGSIEADELKASESMNSICIAGESQAFLRDFFYELQLKCLITLQNFLRDLLREAKKSQEVTEDQLIQYTDTMVTIHMLITLIPNDSYHTMAVTCCSCSLLSSASSLRLEQGWKAPTFRDGQVRLSL